MQLGVESVSAHAVFLAYENGEVGVVVSDAFDIFQHADAGNVLERFAVTFGDIFAACDGFIDLLQVQETVCGADFVHLAVDAGGDNGCFSVEPEVFEKVDSPFGRFVMADKRSAFDCIIDFGRMETERAHVACLQDGFPIDGHSERMGGIVDNFETVNVCNFLDALCIARRAIDVHWHDGRGVRRDGGFDFFWIDVSRFFVNIDKHGLETVPQDGMSCRDKTVRSRDDFAGNFHRLQCGTIGILQSQNADKQHTPDRHKRYQTHN